MSETTTKSNLRITLPAILTADWFRDMGACDVEKVKKEWPAGSPLTRAVLLRAAELRMDICWFAEKILDAPAWADYQRIKDQALADYQRIKDQALADYQRIKDQALADYQRITAPALADYNRVMAECLADLLGLE